MKKHKVIFEMCGKKILTYTIAPNLKMAKENILKEKITFHTVEEVPLHVDFWSSIKLFFKEKQTIKKQ